MERKCEKVVGGTAGWRIKKKKLKLAIIIPIVGYAVGISVSYVLNKIYTFQSKAHPKKEFPKSVLSLLASYTLNFLTLVLCIHILKINPYISQIISGAVYTLSGFVFLKYFAFRSGYENA
jgi:GtrA-like protein.